MRRKPKPSSESEQTAPKLIYYKSLQSAKNQNEYQRLATELDSYSDRISGFIRACFDDMVRPPVLGLAQQGDFYIELTEEQVTGVTYIFPHPASRNAGVLTLGMTDEAFKQALDHSASKYDYRKFKAEVVDGTESPFVRAGFTLIGVSPAEGLFQGEWKPIILLELMNSRYNDPSGEVLKREEEPPKERTWMEKVFKVGAK